MIEEMLGTNGAKFIVASLVVALALLCLVGVFWFIRNRPSSPFIRGGKNRQPRLAVLDAAAVDTRRRLVLVRRDDVEHLIMIGGPTDIVIESRIPPQRASAPVTPDPVLPQQAVERRVVQPAQNQPVPETKAAPVSAMANVLYGEDSAKPADQPRQTVTPAQGRIRDEAASSRPATVERLPSQPVLLREPSGGVSAAETPFPASKAPEDILEAARNRVLVTGGSVPVPVQDRPVQATAATIPQQTVQKPLSDFESFLDAEISGNLQQLTPESAARPEQGVRPAVSRRQEPKLDMASPGRQEPSLEEEMNRMLGEIADNRKP
ncbi:flagellar biosynthetic protein FliO [Rhizobium sp. 32-5/1]|uniref:flagellar biosynthetic protein FliO n=1 Tax=Rhizobium sp. 32-5/1 TaxID=3019602 RepID=UPI00240E550D|nr:flagellar biosynthetic protein FliO [Rhizobium sp. 32-5/1]WEZ83327.1 flagellar biosynthetic protein FliO [Rhizobium sp. 32-5/1]